MEEPLNHMVSPARRVAKLVTTLAGMVVGIGALSFLTGFLAQKAQYEYLQVPFVFVDYWAYAETGSLALVRSIYLLASKPFALVALTILSIAIIFLLESGQFRRAILKPHWSFLGYIVLLVVIGILIRQQLQVRTLREGPRPIFQENTDGQIAENMSGVPTLFPYSLMVPKPTAPPKAEQLRFSGSSDDIWSRIADDIEIETRGGGAIYLEVRPDPTWVSSKIPKPETDEKPSVLGIEIAPERRPSARAEELYRNLVVTLAVAFWGFLILCLWQQQIRKRYLAYEPAGTAVESSQSWRRRSLDHIQNTLILLREEIWFSSHWILGTLVALALITSTLFLMPECYGLLAMPRLGQEFVEAISLESREDSEDSESLSEVDVATETRRARRFLERFGSLKGPSAQRTKEWVDQIETLEKANSPDASRVLKVMWNASAAISPDLSDMAYEALRRVSARSYSSAEGFILYYPRSETDYLRILQQSPHSATKRWTIYPVQMSSIREVRVKRDETSYRIIKLLRGMADLRAQERIRILIEAQELGHDRLLEVAIAGTFDPSHIVRGPSITDVGHYAAGLPARETLRRQVAALRLLEIIRDPGQRADHRGAAATALYHFVDPGDDRVCGELIDTLGAQARTETWGWVFGGSIITTVGHLRCAEAAQLLLTLLVDDSLPVHVRSTIPTQLIRIGTQANSAKTLAKLLNDRATPMDIVGPTITAISRLPGPNARIPAEALSSFLVMETYGDDLTRAGLVQNYRTTAVDALRELGEPGTVDLLHQLARRSTEDDEQVRAKAVIALGEFEAPGSESVLIEIAEDDGEEEMVRVHAVDSLSKFHDNSSARRMAELFDDSSNTLAKEIIESLRYRGRAGSSYARDKASELSRRSIARAAENASGDGQEESPSINGEARPSSEVPINLVVGSSVDGELDPSDETLPNGKYFELYSLTSGTAESFTISLRSTHFDTHLALFSSTLEEPLVDDDSGGGCNSQLTVQPESQEPMVVVVSSTGPGSRLGSYSLSVSELPPPPIPGECSPM